MEPDDAYKTALYYTEGAGRGRTWIRALAEVDADRESQSERRTRDTSVAMSQAPDDGYRPQPSTKA